jgi:predicted membrane channel-forming protein YqfA (hemolysin III family)
MNTVLRLILGLVGGFTLSIAIAGLCFTWAWSKSEDNLVIGVLLIVPVWIASLAFMLVNASVTRAGLWLVAANGACYAALWWPRIALTA